MIKARRIEYNTRDNIVAVKGGTFDRRVISERAVGLDLAAAGAVAVRADEHWVTVVSLTDRPLYVTTEKAEHADDGAVTVRVKTERRPADAADDDANATA